MLASFALCRKINTRSLKHALCPSALLYLPKIRDEDMQTTTTQSRIRSHQPVLPGYCSNAISMRAVAMSGLQSTCTLLPMFMHFQPAHIAQLRTDEQSVVKCKRCFSDLCCLQELSHSLEELAAPAAASMTRQQLAERAVAERMRECTFRPNIGSHPEHDQPHNIRQSQVHASIQAFSLARCACCRLWLERGSRCCFTELLLVPHLPAHMTSHSGVDVCMPIGSASQ